MARRTTHTGARQAREALDMQRAARDFVAAYGRDDEACFRIIASLSYGDASANLVAFLLAVTDIAADATREAARLSEGTE